VQVRVDAASGLIRVVRVVCALDMGVVVNRHGRGRQS
jgi:CO/xanthine dehydrogenase Mo-binding subunit